MTTTDGKVLKNIRKMTKTVWKLVSDGVCMLHLERPETTNLVLVTDRVLPISDNFASRQAAEKVARSLLPRLKGFAIHTPTGMHLYNARGQELEWAATGSTIKKTYALSVGEPITA
jgi:hypothetical protein